MRRGYYFDSHRGRYERMLHVLGKELGVYQDPYQYFGALAAELWRAIRLVVDTGLHHKGWSREQAIDFMLENSGMTRTEVVADSVQHFDLALQDMHSDSTTARFCGQYRRAGGA